MPYVVPTLPAMSQCETQLTDDSQDTNTLEHLVLTAFCQMALELRDW